MSLFNVNVLTIFPEMFPGTLQYSLAGQALKNDLWNLNIIDMRSFSKDKNLSVDDRPYGGGPGMIMRPDILGDAIDSILVNFPNTKLIYMSPCGVKLTQHIARQIISFPNITILCGRFEGVDKRVVDFYNFYEISIGDYILSGGELPAQVLIDTCIRLIPGIMNNSESIIDESFNYDMLEYPQYTRPLKWKDCLIPEVLLSGHHEKIKKWRTDQSYLTTKQRRPDLIKKGVIQND